MTTTKLETLVLTAIALSEYHDADSVANNPVWVDCVTDVEGVTLAQVGGVFSSLNKKGLAWSDGTYCAITQEGIDSLPPAIVALLG